MRILEGERVQITTKVMNENDKTHDVYTFVCVCVCACRSWYAYSSVTGC